MSTVRSQKQSATVKGACLSLTVHTIVLLTVISTLRTDTQPDQPQATRINLAMFKVAAVAPPRNSTPTSAASVQSTTPPLPVVATVMNKATAQPDAKPAGAPVYTQKTTPPPTADTTPILQQPIPKPGLKNKAIAKINPSVSADKPARYNKPDEREVTLVTASITALVAENRQATDTSQTLEPTPTSDPAVSANNVSDKPDANTHNSSTVEPTSAEHASYTREVRKAVLQQRSYPQRARRKQLTGTVVVSFRIFANGTLASTEVIRSSGHRILDRAAVKAVHNAGRFRPFPQVVNRQYWDFEVPIVFQ